MKEMTLKEIQKALGYEIKVVAEKQPKKYKNVNIGEITNIANIDWIVLDKTDDGVLCLSKDFVYKNTSFDSNTPNYTKSSICKKLNNDFLKELADEIGENNIIESEIDLTSLDGLDDFGKTTNKVGLLTYDMYRKYNRIIEKYIVDDWWWLSTPWSTPHRGWHSAVCCVSRGGSVFYGVCRYCSGVRPFCIFSSSIFES